MTDTARAKARWRSVLAWIERRLPLRLRLELMGRGDTKFWRERDAEEDARGRLPEDEHLDPVALWIVDFYPPSRVKALESGLRRLGFHVADLGHDRDPTNWLAESRESAFGGGWTNVGYVVPPGEYILGPTYVNKPLPAHFDRVAVTLASVSPSLTALTLQWHISESAGLLLRDTFNRAYRTRRVRRPRSIQYLGSAAQRSHAARQDLSDLVAAAAAWTRGNLPGWFTSKADHAIPSCLFLATSLAEPFTRLKEPRLDSYVEMLRLDRDIDAWEIRDFPGLQVRVPSFDSETPNWVMAGRSGAFMQDDFQKAYGGNNRAGWASRLWYFNGAVLALATTEFLRDLHGEVGRARDIFAAPLGASRRRRVRNRPDVVATLGIDIEPIARELARKRDADRLVRDLKGIVPGPENIERRARRRLDTVPVSVTREAPETLITRIRRRLFGVPEATPDQPKPQEPQPIQSLADQIGYEIRNSARRLEESSTGTREAISVSASLQNADETNRLNLRLLWLTVIFGIATVITAIPVLLSLLRNS